jgi:MFS family permease
VRPARRRWLIVLALFIVTYGIATPLAAFGVFLPVLTETFGWSRGAVAAALSINLLLGGVAGFGVGAVADRHGPRLMLAVTVALAGIGFALVATVASLWQLYVFVGVLGGVGMSSFYLLAASTVTYWFKERRGLALSLVLVGFNVGYIVAGPLAAWLIAHLGWRAAYATLGGGAGVVSVLAALTVRLPRADESRRLRPAVATGAGAPATIPPGVTLRSALADPRQWCLNVAWLFLGSLSLMVSVHAVPFARDQGISLAAASVALTAYGVGAVLGRLMGGAVSDWLGTATTLRMGYLIQFAAAVALPLAPSRDALLAALVVFGLGFAACDTLITKVVPDVFGVRALGAIMGVLSLGWRSGAAAGPAAAGFLYDVTGSYAVPFWAAPAVVLLSWTLLAVARAAPGH